MLVREVMNMAIEGRILTNDITVKLKNGDKTQEVGNWYQDNIVKKFNKEVKRFTYDSEKDVLVLELDSR